MAIAETLVKLLIKTKKINVLRKYVQVDGDCLSGYKCIKFFLKIEMLKSSAYPFSDETFFLSLNSLPTSVVCW